MGWVEMSERELRRAEVLASVLAGRLTMTAAAGLMGVTRRQAHRLARQFAERKRLQQPKDQKEAARIFRMMARAGFSSRVIVQLLRQWKVEDEALSALEQEREAAALERSEEEEV